MPKVGLENYGVTSSLYVEDGSYLRFKTLTIGATLPKNLTDWAKIEKFRVYVTFKNLFTWTKYSGYDPEVSNSTPLLQGIDAGGYPQVRMITYGINLIF
jgi:hypothetical protein